MYILIVRNTVNAEALAMSGTLGAYLAAQGIRFATVDASDLSNDEERKARKGLLDPAPDMIIVLGGDGTMLRTVHFMHPLRVPLLGINFGHLGFLTNDEKPGVLEIVSAALAGDVTVERRTCLSVEFLCAGDGPSPYDDEEVAATATSNPSAPHTATTSPALPTAIKPGTDGDPPSSALTSSALTPDESEPVDPDEAAECPTVGAVVTKNGVDSSGLEGQRTFFALNEVAVTRGAMGRIIDFSFAIGGSRVATLRGDGLVVATATGSTAYALSAGGPLVAPSHGGLVVVPLAVHSFHSRAFVTGPSDVVEVDLNDRGTFRDATVFLDGEMLLFPSPVRKAIITSRGAAVEFLRYGGESFYSHASEVFF